MKEFGESLIGRKFISNDSLSRDGIRIPRYSILRLAHIPKGNQDEAIFEIIGQTGRVRLNYAEFERSLEEMVDEEMRNLNHIYMVTGGDAYPAVRRDLASNVLTGLLANYGGPISDFNKEQRNNLIDNFTDTALLITDNLIKKLSTPPSNDNSPPKE